MGAGLYTGFARLPMPRAPWGLQVCVNAQKRNVVQAIDAHTMPLFPTTFHINGLGQAIHCRLIAKFINAVNVGLAR